MTLGLKVRYLDFHKSYARATPKAAPSEKNKISYLTFHIFAGQNSDDNSGSCRFPGIGRL